MARFEVYWICFFWMVCNVGCLRFSTFGKGKTGVAGMKLHLSASQSLNAPFLNAMIQAVPIIKERYFFPGHAGGLLTPSELMEVMGKQVFLFDLPELDELDNIHSPQGPLRESLELTAKLFGAGKSWYLVNGSTSGILTAVVALMRRFKAKSKNLHKVPKFLIGRDAHKSVYDGIRIADSGAILLPCDTDPFFEVSLGISTARWLQDSIEENHDSICGLVLTRPSYQGLLTSPEQLRATISLCHQYDIPVLVDEAHGSHLKFLARPGLDALSCGADIVVQSAHKTLNSVTQTAMMHLSKSMFEAEPDFSDVLHAAFSSLTTTSPNSFLLASLDATQAEFTLHGQEKVQQTEVIMQKMKNLIRSQCPSIGLLEDSAAVLEKGLLMDPLRLSLQFRNTDKGVTDSTAVDDLMCTERGIYCELNLEKCLSYVIGAGRDESSLDRLYEALLETNRMIEDMPSRDVASLSSSAEGTPVVKALSYLDNEGSYLGKVLHRRTVLGSDLSDIDTSLVGLTSAETITVYPPGIPVVIRGEVIQQTHLQKLNELRQALLHGDTASSCLASGCTVTGCSDTSLDSILVLS